MTKKSFTNANPAMAFISTATEDAEDFALTQPTKEDLEEKQEAAPANPQAKRNTKPKSKGAKAVPMKTNYAVVETKSKRVQMLMQPSLYDAIKEKAEKEGVSVNEMMHEILKGHLEA